MSEKPVNDAPADLNPIPSVSNDTPDGLQFRLSTVFVLTLVASLLAAYLNPQGSDLLLAGLVTITASLLLAIAVGYVRPPIADRVFWAVVVSAMMQAVTANVILLHRSGIYAWPIVAGFAATIAAGKSSRYVRMFFAAAAAAVSILPYVISLDSNVPVIIAYVICAAIGGALLTILVDFVRWAEQKYHIPQPAIGLMLVVAAIGFSTVASQIVPGW